MDNIVKLGDNLVDGGARLLLHGAWQGALVGLIALAVVRWGRRWPAPVRYWLLVLALVKFVSPPLATLPIGVFSIVAVESSADESRGPGGGVSPAVLSDHPLVPATLPQPGGENELFPHEVATADLGGQAARPGRDSSPASPAVPESVLQSTVRAESRGSTPVAAAAPPGPAPLRGPPWLVPVAMLIYAAGALLMLALAATRAAALHVSRRGMALPDATLVASMESIARRLGLRRMPLLRISARDQIPYSVGVLRPAIVIPARLIAELSAEERHAVLCHELAHHRRGDLWLNLLQLAIGVVWWFHPVVWLLNRAIRSVREECCDDLLLARKFVTEEDYCTTLVRVAEGHARHRLPGVCVSMADGPHPLAIRVRRIMDESLGRTERPGRWGALVLCLTALVVLPGVRAVPSSAAGTAPGDWSIFRPNHDRLPLTKPPESAVSRKMDLSPSERPTSPRANAPSRSSTADSPPASPRVAVKTDPTPPEQKSASAAMPSPASAVSVRVTDVDGRPIERATVVLGTMPLPQDFKPQTDAEGRCRFDRTPPGQNLLTVFKPGLGPEVRPITISAETPENEFEFQLKEGRSIEIRVIDTAGRPVAGAGIVPDTWRDTRTLWVSHPFGETDADGRWRWDWAPHDAVKYVAYKKGHMGIHWISLEPRAEPHVLTLLPELHVTGNVTDDTTGSPIEAFRVVPGYAYREGAAPSWSPGESVTGTNGRYSIRQSSPQAVHVIRIEADGYLPLVSRVIRSNEGEIALDFRLKPGKPPRGTIISPEGTPVAGVDVVLASPAGYAHLQDGKVTNQNRSFVVRTDAAGEFHFPVQTDDFSVVVCDASGLGQARRSDFEKTADEPLRITLKPWARIDGIVGTRERPLGKQPVRLQFIGSQGNPYAFAPFVSATFRTETGDDGHFRFDRIPPETEVHVIQTVPIPMSTHMGDGQGASARFKTMPGETQTVALGAAGRSIVGRVEPKGDDKPPHDWETCYGELVPERKAAGKGAADSAAVEAIGPGIVDHSTGHFRIQRDGTFRIDGVLPGAYHLRIAKWVTHNPAPSQSSIVPLAHQQIVVPEREANAPDAPIDAGTVKVNPVPTD